MPVNGFLVQNNSSAALWISDVGVASAGGASIQIAANGGIFATPSGYKPAGAVSLLWRDDRPGLCRAPVVTRMRPTIWIDRALTAAALIAGILVAWSALAQSPGNFSTLDDDRHGDAERRRADVLGPSVDRRHAATVPIGDDSHDDTAAIQTTIDTAIANNWPVHVPAGKYKVTSLAHRRLREPGVERLPR